MRKTIQLAIAAFLMCGSLASAKSLRSTPINRLVKAYSASLPKGQTHLLVSVPTKYILKTQSKGDSKRIQLDPIKSTKREGLYLLGKGSFSRHLRYNDVGKGSVDHFDIQ